MAEAFRGRTYACVPYRTIKKAHLGRIGLRTFRELDDET
jgi:hypothetical protein